ncbi:trypsin-like peptidase domain-containing protein [Candidatus Gracilibacteria bacterium]|nr:trypsin-like peptidase domain-containing protein [Candidatus Gracilibacteria bacterium]
MTESTQNITEENITTITPPPPYVHHISRTRAISYAVIAAVLFSSGAFYAGTQLSPAGAEAVENSNFRIGITTAEPILAPLQTFSSEEAATIAAVKKIAPAVVSIVIKKNINSLTEDNKIYFIDPFTGKPLSPSNPSTTTPPTTQKEIGGGTGFIVSSDGYIVTNKHVVNDKGVIYSIFLSDGTEYSGTLLDTDPINDLAVLKIDGRDLPTVELNDSSTLQVGQTVLAVGNSLNEYRQTVSKGIISGLDRTITASDQSGRARAELSGIIQTDAAINPGNSGGPLINLQGQVIGINTAIDRSGQSIGFAIPINDAKFIIDSIKATGRVVRPQLGVRYMMITKAVAAANQLPVDYGALVIKGDSSDALAVVPGSGADKAGIVENDIILELNGQKLDETNSLAKAIQKFHPGDTIKVKVYHKGEQKDLSITLNESQPQQ